MQEQAPKIKKVDEESNLSETVMVPDLTLRQKEFKEALERVQETHPRATQEIHKKPDEISNSEEHRMRHTETLEEVLTNMKREYVEDNAKGGPYTKNKPS